MFDLTNVESVSFEPIPAGKYLVRVVDAELQDTKDGSGQYIKAQFEVIGDSYSGRKIFHNFNTKNKNPQAVQIGLGQLKSLVECSGSNNFKLNSPMDLVNMEAVANVKIKKSAEYEDQNVISGFSKKQASQAKVQTPSDVPF
jgi:hypothetical protein